MLKLVFPKYFLRYFFLEKEYSNRCLCYPGNYLVNISMAFLQDGIPSRMKTLCSPVFCFHSQSHSPKLKTHAKEMGKKSTNRINTQNLFL